MESSFVIQNSKFECLLSYKFSSFHSLIKVKKKDLSMALRVYYFNNECLLKIICQDIFVIILAENLKMKEFFLICMGAYAGNKDALSLIIE